VRRWLPLVALGALFAACAMAAPATAADGFAAKCSAVGALLPRGATLASTELVDPAPSWQSPPSQTSPNGETVRAPFCRVVGAIDGDIGFEIWLPRDWNRRLLGTGVGGEAGYFNYVDMARGIEGGFVAASSDTGHKRGEPWIADRRKVENYAHIAYHRLTEVAKNLSNAFYGIPPTYSYFIGCSGGGRQGLREMQLYPADYDGALIGAPGQDVPLLAARFIQVYLAQATTPGGDLTAADWDLIARSATAACDGQDGLLDGVVSDPRQCGFRVRRLACGPNHAISCLSPAKVKAAEAIVAPLTGRDGRTYDYGLLPGITTRPGGMPPLPLELFGKIVHRDPNWDPRRFDIAADLPAARAAFPTMDASDADLTRFAARGGRLILYHGWADASVQPEATIDFFDRLRLRARPDREAYARLYMVPGMQHCRGGNGTDRFGASEDRLPTGKPQGDLLAALMAWVERSNAPDTILARRVGPGGAVDRTRPLCPYPQEAAYRGRGDINDASAFGCVTATARR
jgi:feruloyl esterase